MDTLCEQFDCLYVNDNVLEFRNQSSGKSRTNQRAWAPFIREKLRTTKMRVLDSAFRVSFARDVPDENIALLLDATARNVVKTFFTIHMRECIQCGSKSCLTRAHTTTARPELLRLAIRESAQRRSDVILRRFIELHIEHPIAVLCGPCHRELDA